MTVAEYQKRLNQDIARELDKYQVMLEYGRMLLDKDKRIRRSYKWISLSKKSCISGAALDFIVSIITAIFSSETFAKHFPFMLALLLLSVFIYVAILYKNRNKISQLFDEEEKNEFITLMDRLHEYLCKLGEWLKDVDSHIQQNNEVIRSIEKEFAVAKSKQANDVNKISMIQGELDEALDKEAHKIACLRLQPFKHFIYEDE